MKRSIVMPATFVVTAWDRIVASDPGLGRLFLALRVTLAVAFTAVALGLLVVPLHAPVTVVLFGAIVAMQASLAVTDSEPRTTTLLVPIPGIIGVTLGAYFAARGIFADLAFLVVLFGAVAIRSGGPRWTAFGTIAMMTYFFALFIAATLDQLPALVGAVLVGTACSYLAQFVLLPDRPAWIARRTLEAYEARLRVVTATAYDVSVAPEHRRLRHQLDVAVQRLNETATAIESRLDLAAVDDVRIIFDAELAAEDLATAVLRLRDCNAPMPRAVRLALLAASRGAFARAARIAQQRVPLGSGVTARDGAIARAIVALCATIERVKTTSASLGRSNTSWVVSGAQQPALRQAIQVTLAAAVAIAAGEALSPQRWYWAVLATYFVFIGTASSGETLARAWSRIAGTAVGAIAGVIVGMLVINDTAVAAIALFACLFLGVYVLRVSHAMMMFFITASLALLYIVLGRFSDDLLGIRLAETAIGAVCGGFAATFILPTKTHAVVREQAIATLEAIRALVGASIARLVDPQSAARPLDAARVLEECVQGFAARAGPAVSTPTLLGGRHDLRRWIVLFRTCSYYGRTLARVVDRDAVGTQHDASELLSRLDALIAIDVDRAIARIDESGDREGTATATVFDALHLTHAPDADTTLEAATDLLERIDGAVDRLARDLSTLLA
ncbi:MAG: FUSC family protein [Vulcanimicrobiaceae bacterium]